jgi:hypothetical protein
MGAHLCVPLWSATVRCSLRFDTSCRCDLCEVDLMELLGVHSDREKDEAVEFALHFEAEKK